MEQDVFSVLIVIYFIINRVDNLFFCFEVVSFLFLQHLEIILFCFVFRVLCTHLYNISTRNLQTLLLNCLTHTLQSFNLLCSFDETIVITFHRILLGVGLRLTTYNFLPFRCCYFYKRF